MAKKSNDKATGNVGFEDQLWEAASILWGSMNPNLYQNIVLGLVFLKYISDRFEEKHKQLVEEGEGFEEDEDEYTSEVIFFVPPEARWSYILQFASKPEIGSVIDNAMVAIEKKHPVLSGVLPKDYASPNNDKAKLGEVVIKFSNILMNTKENDRDVLGRTYEYFLVRFSKNAGKGGEFFTPPCIVKTLVNVIQPFKGRVYDPCCGSGGMFVQSASFIREHQGNLVRDVTIYGQDANPETWKLCKMNLAIRGIEANLGKSNADTFHNDQHPTLKADFILANPPFNLDNWGANKIQDDPRWAYGIPSDSNANYAWIQHMISHLSTNGRIGLVLANGSLSSNSNNEGVIRKNIVNADLVEGIVSLPAQLFYTVQIPVCLWFISRNKQNKGKTLFIDARKMGSMVTRTQRELSAEDIQRIVDIFNTFRTGGEVDIQGFSKAVAIDEISKQDFILTPGRYVGIEEQEDDGEPFEEKMTRLTSELSGLFAKSHELEEEIRKKLGAIGYEI
ncbi:MAG: type I restriction-modification system subunit M [Sphaerochaetaceae bacterium]|nr:type I restriction-modification system subunit M [Sphaerochaetaceae bacterium]